MKRVLGVVVLALVAVAPSTASATIPAVYKNCTNLNKTYPHGLGQTTARDHVTSGRPVTTFTKSNARFAAAMKANAGLDRDKDHIACEKH
ncbi:MAG: hypothetical protein JWO12_2020 [Frankiales bacterium]|nr:hypothetical protein [Frankiales bacterium]